MFFTRNKRYIIYSKIFNENKIIYLKKNGDWSLDGEKLDINNVFQCTSKNEAKQIIKSSFPEKYLKNIFIKVIKI